MGFRPFTVVFPWDPDRARIVVAQDGQSFAVPKGDKDPDNLPGLWWFKFEDFPEATVSRVMFNHDEAEWARDFLAGS